MHRPSFVPSTRYTSHPVLILLEGNLDLLNGGLDGSEADCRLTLELSVRGSVMLSKYWGAYRQVVFISSDLDGVNVFGRFPLAVILSNREH